MRFVRLASLTIGLGLAAVFLVLLVVNFWNAHQERCQSESMRRIRAWDDALVLVSRNHAKPNVESPEELSRFAEFAGTSPFDGWGRRLSIRFPGGGREIRSLGSDGIPDSGDAGAAKGFGADIVLRDGNWTQFPEGW